MSKYHKRIVLDFDDTLAFTTNRDFKNAKPNKLLINKINQLYKDGWQIDIFTARGSISCETRADAEAKYGEEIRQWLFENILFCCFISQSSDRLPPNEF